MHSRPIKHRGGPIGGPGRRHPAQQRKRWAKQLQGRMRDAGLAIARHVHAVLHLLLATPTPPPLAPPRRTPEPWAAESPREFGADRALPTTVTTRTDAWRPARRRREVAAAPLCPAAAAPHHGSQFRTHQPARRPDHPGHPRFIPLLLPLARWQRALPAPGPGWWLTYCHEKRPLLVHSPASNKYS